MAEKDIFEAFAPLKRFLFLFFLLYSTHRLESMKSANFFTIASLASVVLADLPTFTSTIVSSSCSLGPSTFKFSNDSAPVTAAAVSEGSTIASSEPLPLEEPSPSSEDVIYETEVITNDSVFTTDRIVCNGGSCYTTTGLETWTTTTATVDGVLTTFVTHVPVSSSADSVTSEGSGLTEASAVTKTDVDTTVVTITSCSDNKCTPTAVTTGVTIVTSTIKGEETVYTTYCPISSEEAPTSSVKPQTVHSTTVVTVSSCSENICHSSAVTTGVTQLTTTIHGVESIYTTYCPIEPTSSEIPPAPESTYVPPAPKEETLSKTEYVTVTTSETQKSQPPAPSGTVNVITNNIVTQYSTSSSDVPVSTSSVPFVSTYEGGAAQAVPAIIGAVPILLALM